VKDDPTGWATFGRYFSLAVTLPAASITGYGIGYWLDGAFHTSYLKFVLLILGTVGGFIQLIKGLDKG